MACYVSRLIRFDRMSEALGRLDIDLMDLRPDEFAEYAHERRQQLRTLVELYLDQTAHFFQGHASCGREKATPGAQGSAKSSNRPRFETSLRHLRQLVIEAFEKGQNSKPASWRNRL